MLLSVPAPGLFDDDSMLRRVHREQVVALSGPRALLMQASHPVAFAGFFASTASLEAPYERLARTAQVMELIGFGPREEAMRATRRVRAVHRRIRGRLREPAGPFPAGTPYAADDPALLLWILACLVDSGLVVYERYVRPLTRGDRQAYWRDQREVGRRFGLTGAQMPDSIEDFGAYMHDMLTGDQLQVTDAARELGIRIVMQPPVPLPVRPLLELANFITVGLLPRRLRRGYGLRWDPARELVLRSGAEYTRRVLVPLLPGRVRYTPAARAA